MKTIKKLLILIATVSLLAACNDTWDSHYTEQEPTINNDNVLVVSYTTNEYIKSETSLSAMYGFFNDTKVLDEIKDKDQLTLLVVENGNISSSIDLDDPYLAQTHVSDISIAPASLYDGEKVLMLNGKYLTVSVSTEGANDKKVYSFNNIKVNKIIKTTDGYIYVLNSLVQAPKSLYETIETLDDDYSIFRDMILSRNEKIFDKTSSIPIGVDNTGSTIYDSVFIVTNPYFNAKDFNLASEALTATLLIPSNTIVQEAINTAKSDLAAWGMERADSIVQNWVFQSAFFNKEYTKQDFEDNTDLKSIFDKQWRTTVQQVDLDNPIEMSNGTAYYVKWMKIPTNVLIYRVKDYFKWYEFLTTEDKAKYYQTENLVFNKCDTKVTSWSGWPAGGFPYIENRILIFKMEDPDLQSYTLKFKPFQYFDKGDGSYDAIPYIIPPGEYDLCMGFMQRKDKNEDIAVSFNDVFVRTIAQNELTATTFHYDRGGQGYPEGYDTKLATDSKKSNYHRDGGKVGVVSIESAPREVLITLKGSKALSDANFHHWCLKPTANCY